MILDTRQKLIKYWKDKGIENIEETIWSSSLRRENLERVRTFLNSNGFNYLDISIVFPNDEKTKRTKFRTHYDLEGQCYSTNYAVAIPANSNNLKLTVGLEQNLKNQECQDKTLQIINCLRIIFGIPIARELMLVTNSNIDDFLNAKFSSELGFASPFDTQNLNFYEDIEYSELRQIPVEALILLDKAFQQRFPKERFIIMWVAFESIVNSIYPSDHNGNKRSKYFKEELKSDIANEEVFRLFKIRNDVFKEGKFQHDEFDNENWSLYAAIQLTMLDECSQRTAFLKGYEEIILNRL